MKPVKPTSKIILLTVPSGASFVGHIFLYFCSRLFIDALWSPAGKGLTPWLSFMMLNCEVVTFPLVSWVRCGA